MFFYYYYYFFYFFLLFFFLVGLVVPSSVFVHVHVVDVNVVGARLGLEVFGFCHHRLCFRLAFWLIGYRSAGNAAAIVFISLFIIFFAIIDFFFDAVTPEIKLRLSQPPLVFIWFSKPPFCFTLFCFISAELVQIKI